LWGQKFARELKINSPVLFDQAYNEWVGVAAVKFDLIDPNLTSINSIKINHIIFNNINNMMLKFNQILEDQDNFSAKTETIKKLNEDLELIISNILPKSIICYDFIISNAPLNNQFFEQFDRIYKNFNINLDQINETNILEVLWKNFIQSINDIYVSIADTFWEDQKYLYPNKLRKTKIRAAKSRMFSEAQKIMEMENVSKPTSKQIDTYRSMAGIPGLQDISDKIFYINLKLILK
jgi:hypothetical protein